MKVHRDADRCQGHGRCYDLAPEVFGEDEEGYSVVLAEVVPPPAQASARLAAANCPESAIVVEEERA